MANDTVTLKIDDLSVTVPAGTFVVDAAKTVGIDIPVFCYHPKLEPVGMCRMCLVEVGRPVIDRATGQVQHEPDGSIKVMMSPKLETACTTVVSPGMVVVTNSDKVQEARREVVEFLLTSHPLDCPVCDKGGECPLQNLTMAFGPGQSRFLLDEKMHLAKHHPLGELIYLDRERCIQCARCIRFQDEVVDDPVIGFSQRGRSLQIVTHSTPGFDSVFSGNTTDICPVGALTTHDFRFGARPWELNSAASVCNHCPVGCNTVMNVRREQHSGGRKVIKRIMPRQNEDVNEIWICDKGRFVYHYAESPERIDQPLVRKDGQLVPASWEEALDKVAEQFKAAGASLVTLAGGRLSNEDLFNMQRLTDAQGGQALLDSYMAGGDLVAGLGLPEGSNLKDMGPETAILVVASDLHQEAPLWWLRLKQAAERGAKLIVANPRPTRLDKFATHVVRYPYGGELEALKALFPARYQSAGGAPLSEAAQAFAGAQDAVIFFGSEGLGLSASQALSRLCAALLVQTNHTGRPNNGLVGVWPKGNTQGAWDMGFRPAADLAQRLDGARLAYIAAADPAGDDPALADALDQAGFVVVQELFLTETARRADVVLPAQAFNEREGSYTNGERRLQRFYPGVPPLAGTRPDFTITAQIGRRLGVTLEERAAALVLLAIAEQAPGYGDMTYQKLAETHEQLPLVGRQDLYYGGTGYDNHQGLGQKLGPGPLPPATELEMNATVDALHVPAGSLPVFPATRLYDRGNLMHFSPLLNNRRAGPELLLNPETAAGFGLEEGDTLHITVNGVSGPVSLRLAGDLPAGVGVMPRRVGFPLNGPAVVELPHASTVSG
ncbi:MAG: NADH-quinone oxidoreductase subunit NuoG [Chloroflexi bacterium]|nr:NADH-quinone oxidoreductase subunit NuoG [Chloroflexota bacterium]